MNWAPYILLTVCWVVYFALHSALATSPVKRALSFLGHGYRLFYSLVAVGGLVFILFLMAFIPVHPLWPSATWNQFLGLMLSTYGVILLMKGFKAYSLVEFIGWRQVKEKKPETNELKREGLLAYMRHPLYTATFLIAWGYFLFSPNLTNLISMVLINAYLIIGTYWEEKKLVKAFGQAYKTYQQEVPRFIPNQIPKLK